MIRQGYCIDGTEWMTPLRWRIESLVIEHPSNSVIVDRANTLRQDF